MKKTVFAGFGGQGVIMMGYVFAVAAMNEGQEITYLPAYGAEMRGGTANCTVAVSDEEIFSPVASAPDYAVIMNNPSLTKFENMVKKGGTILINSSLVTKKILRNDVNVIPVPASDMAKKLRNEQISNMIMLGALVETTKIVTMDSVALALTETSKGRKARIANLNKKGLVHGAEYISRGVAQ